MTTETNSVFESVKQAFAPVTDALKNFQTIGVPETAREFVKTSASSAKERTAEALAGAEKVTAAIETAVTEGVIEASKISRTIQQAVHQDAEAFFEGISRLASAKSFGEAVQIQSDLARTHGETLVSRAKATGEYVGKRVADGAKTIQDNFAKASSTSV